MIRIDISPPYIIGNLVGSAPLSPAAVEPMETQGGETQGQEGYAVARLLAS